MYTFATPAATGRGGERHSQQPVASRHHSVEARVPIEERSLAPRQPAEATRHARGRSARHPAPSAGTPAADHAAALWQLCCRIRTTTTIACQVVDSRARCHRVQMATIAERGANAGTARRARDGGRAQPAIRHRVCIRARSCVRRLTILVPIGAGFGHGTRTHTLSRSLAGREASKCAVRAQSEPDGPPVGPKAETTNSRVVHPTGSSLFCFGPRDDASSAVSEACS